MTQGSRGLPVTRNFLELQRPSKKGYCCPICPEISHQEPRIWHQEPRIWEHALKVHKELLGALETPEMVRVARQKYREQALAHA